MFVIRPKWFPLQYKTFSIQFCLQFFRIFVGILQNILANNLICGSFWSFSSLLLYNYYMKLKAWEAFENFQTSMDVSFCYFINFTKLCMIIVTWFRNLYTISLWQKAVQAHYLYGGSAPKSGLPGEILQVISQ